MKRGKKYAEAAKLIERDKQYEVAEAISLIKKTATAKFDETVEAHIRLGVDGRHADQQVRGAVVLPHGTGKKVRVLVFAKGDKVAEMLFFLFEENEVEAQIRLFIPLSQKDNIEIVGDYVIAQE